MKKTAELLHIQSLLHVLLLPHSLPGETGNKCYSHLPKDNLSLNGLLNTAWEIYPDFDLAQVPSAPSTLLTVRQDPVSSSLPSCFELVPTACIQMYCLQPTFQQLSQPGKTLRRDAAHSFWHCCMSHVPVCWGLFCHGFSAGSGHSVKSPPNTFSSGWAPGIIRMCVGLHQGMVQTNNCNLLCTARMGDSSKTWTTKLIRDNYVFLKIIKCCFVLDFSCWLHAIAKCMSFIYECKKTMVCLISLLVLDMRSIHLWFCNWCRPRRWGIPNFCYNSAGFMLSQSWWWGANCCWLPDILHHPVPVSAWYVKQLLHFTVWNILKRPDTHLQSAAEK